MWVLWIKPSVVFHLQILIISDEYISVIVISSRAT